MLKVIFIVTGVNLDHLLRISGNFTGLPEMWDSRKFNGSFAFDNKMMKYRYEDRGYGRTKADMQRLLTTQDQKVIIVRNEYFFAIQKAGTRLFIYNCHNTARDPMMAPEAGDPASVVQADSVQAASEILFIASKVGESPVHLFNVYAVFCELADDQK